MTEGSIGGAVIGYVQLRELEACIQSDFANRMVILLTDKKANDNQRIN